MIPIEVKAIRKWFMLATEKDKATMAAWLNGRDDVLSQSNEYMSIEELKNRYMAWEDHYWKGLRKWMYVGAGLVAAMIASSFI